MSDDTEQRFYEGDVLAIRDNSYEVDRVDITPNGDVLQYRLNTRDDAPPATLIPNADGYTVKEFHSCDPIVIE